MQKTIRSTRICAASMCLCQGLTFSSLEQKCALQLTCYATAGGRLAAVHEPRMAPAHVRPACLAPGLTRHGFLLGNHVHGQHGHGGRCLLAWGQRTRRTTESRQAAAGTSSTCPCPCRARPESVASAVVHRAVPSNEIIRFASNPPDLACSPGLYRETMRFII